MDRCFLLGGACRFGLASRKRPALLGSRSVQFNHYTLPYNRIEFGGKLFI
jgi:hypothetical protein